VDWGSPAEDLAPEVKELQNSLEALTAGLRFRDQGSALGSLVSADSLRAAPVHRWYYYKEGFSPLLPPLLANMLGTGKTKTVVDSFAGVATTALSLRTNEATARVIGIEYSPFAHFVGKAKLASSDLDPASLERHAQRLSAFRISRKKTPRLAAFHNEEIFDPKVLRGLISARDAINHDPILSDPERGFFLLGLAAIIEDLSGVMKDGRALRILRGRNRRALALRPTVEPLEDSSVRSTVINQWRAMIEDLATLRSSNVDARHVLGDARCISAILSESGAPLIEPDSVGLHLYSPPYLNCIDYTEVYKLELWLLEFVSDGERFRRLREGTLRSHPSIEFPARPVLPDRTYAVHEAIDSVTSFLTSHVARPALGRVHGYYFADMDEVLRQQFSTLEAGGAIACVVANSTFSRRVKRSSGSSELWRVPILTDVLIARLAEAIGFVEIEIWIARNIQAKNVSGGLARESIVVARKPH